MKHRDSFYRLEDVIDMDDAFVGGKRPGKRGRNSRLLATMTSAGFCSITKQVTPKGAMKFHLPCLLDPGHRHVVRGYPETGPYMVFPFVDS